MNASSQQITLRPAAEADLPRLVEIARRSWLSAFAQTLPFEAIRDWVAADRAPGWYATYWPTMTVAELGGEIVGLVQPAADEVNGLWVHPSVQGRGVGARLLAEAERQIAAAGHGKAWLTCSGVNPRAQGFYAARGYRVVRRYTEPFPCGYPEEMLVYERALTPPAAR